MKKIMLTQICSCKGRSIFIVFSDNCGYSLILFQYLKGDSFLKVSYMVVPETHIKELFVC